LYLRFGAWYLGLGIWNLELGIWYLELGTWIFTTEASSHYLSAVAQKLPAD
jgi:hypothetical protein